MLTGLVYSICVVFVALAPQASTAFFGYILHLNLTGIVRVVSLGSFVTGLLFWSLGTGLYAAAIARLYNRLLVK
jgi:hypothetical protein